MWRRLFQTLKKRITLIRYMGASAITFTADYSAFILSHLWISNTTVCIFIGRGISILVNYTLARHLVFRSKTRFLSSFYKYVLVVLVSGLLTSFMVTWMQSHWRIYALLAKMIAEALLYFVNYFLLKRIFTVQFPPDESAV